MSANQQTTTNTAIAPDGSQPKLVTRTVRHDFSVAERQEMGQDLARAHGGLRGLEAEFDQVKASYKSRTAEFTARIENLSTNLVNGFEMRDKQCRVVYFPKERKKRFYLADHPDNTLPVLEEAMTPEDYQADLIQAEAKFEARKEIELFAVGADKGLLVVGRLGDRWFTALRITMAGRKLSERLDSEQKSVKQRPDAVRAGVKRALEWIETNFGAQTAKGFDGPFDLIIEANKEKVE